MRALLRDSSPAAQNDVARFDSIVGGLRVSYYLGEPLLHNDVGLCPGNLGAVLAAPKSSDYEEAINHWARLAELRSDILYFAVSYRDEVIGQIFLHDWDRTSREALVGYHIYQMVMRGRGIGGRALLLLQRYVSEMTDIVALTAITTDDNEASQGIARRAGFERMGPSREDPEHGVVMRWQVARPHFARELTERGGFDEAQ